ncbi:MAG TPA: hypothetical protein VLH14_01825 [Patescibacteria group bacterium]|nr:hypothetical protein [Patescibacteria group bacterium]
MFKQVNRRFVAALMAMAVVISNVIAPVAPAFADAGGKNQQVYCNQEGQSGKWKAQIGGPSTEHEFPLTGVFVHDQHDVTVEMDALCAQQYGIPQTPTPATPAPTQPTCQAAGSLTLINTEDYTWSTNPATNGNNGPGTYKITATIRPGVNKLFTNQMKTVVFNNIVVLAQLSGQACPPAPKVTYSDWSYGIVDCTALKATQTRVKTVTPYAWNTWLHTWLPDYAHATITTETQQRDLTSTERMLCTPKPKDTVVYGDWTDGTYKCGDTTVDRTREITTTKYTWNGSEWIANSTTKTEHKSRPATTEEQMSCASQTQPTCETDGTLTLPAYKGDWHKDYKYIVTIGLKVKTYDADKTVTIKHIPQGATVTVKLVSDDCFHNIIFSKTYTFDFADCITIPEPRQVDECGPDNARWIVPADTNEIHWTINADGHLIATAVSGHFTNGHTTIDFGPAEDSNESCPPTVATPVKPQITDCTLILPITLGVTYKKVYLDANGNIVDPAQGGVVTTHQGVLATANPGYVLAPGNDGGKWLDNGSYLYTLDLTGLNCGGGSITPPVVTPPAVTPPAQTVSAALPMPAELPHTGSSLSGLLVTLLATLSTYGAVYFLQPKRR